MAETALQIFRRNVIVPLPLETTGFELDPEITARILALGHTIVEAPIKCLRRTKDEGKKIGRNDWFTAVRTLHRYRRG
jgi:dolichol-phosphate mannosyltransferase